MSILFNEKQIKGLTTELICMTKLIEFGFIVSVPYGNNSRYDLLVDTGKKIFRIQCKSSHLNKNGSYTIKTSNMVSTTTQNREKHYTKEEIDFIVSIIDDQLIFIPVELIQNSQSKIFRKELPNYGAKSNCNLIENFSIEKQLLPLIDN